MSDKRKDTGRIKVGQKEVLDNLGQLTTEISVGKTLSFGYKTFSPSLFCN